MIDRTNVGITTPMTSSDQTSEVKISTFIPPMPEAFSTQVIDQGYTLPAEATTFIPNTTTAYIIQPLTSSIPQTTFPVQQYASIIPEGTTSYFPSPEAQTISVLPNIAAQSIISSDPPPKVNETNLSRIVPTEQVSTFPTTTITNGLSLVLPPIPKSFIDDEDFQRKRPTYEPNKKEYLKFLSGC